jgi:hypothetical protein
METEIILYYGDYVTMTYTLETFELFIADTDMMQERCRKYQRSPGIKHTSLRKARK